MNFPAKDPDEVLDYTIDWTAKLAQGDHITQSTFTVLSGGCTIQSSSHNNTSATVWLQGGTLGATANIRNRVTTNLGRVMDVTALLPILEK